MYIQAQAKNSLLEIEKHWSTLMIRIPELHLSVGERKSQTSSNPAILGPTTHSKYEYPEDQNSEFKPIRIANLQIVACIIQTNRGFLRFNILNLYADNHDRPMAYHIGPKMF